MNIPSKSYRILLVILLIAVAGTVLYFNSLRPKVLLSESFPEIEKTRQPKILTAFFGLDNALPPQARLLYKNALGKDGMPIVFSHEIDPTTLAGSDFEVETQNGTVFQVEFATLMPSNEEFELRTVLLIGEFGNAPENPPISVIIADDLRSRTGHNFKGERIPVIPLEEGPTLSYATHFELTDAYPYVATGRGCDCPKGITKTVVKAVWSGGVRALNGDELGNHELKNFLVTIVHENDTLQVSPFKIADVNDNDNNTDLCIKERGTPIQVTVAKNTAIDPRGDANNTTVAHIVSRW